MKEEYIDQPFIYRPYGKAELAQLYIPNCIRKVAMRKFNHWLRFSPVLWEKLKAEGFNITNRDLTYKQVEIIVNYLGEP